ncbi:MAG: potassium-transporting ATPase subunit C, partial [Sphingobacteriales bacterium 12-47-4]
MKKNVLIALKLSLGLIILCAVIYPLVVALAGKATPNGGKGETLEFKGKVVGYERIGQKFTEDRYFWGRPSAVDYNAAGSAGSNKGPSNPDYLKLVEERIDSFLAHNPGIDRKDIPSDLVTASGSGLDPHISPAAAYIQVKRVAAARKLPESVLRELVEKNTEKIPFGPDAVHVLKLNIALDEL